MIYKSGCNYTRLVIKHFRTHSASQSGPGSRPAPPAGGRRLSRSSSLARRRAKTASSEIGRTIAPIRGGRKVGTTRVRHRASNRSGRAKVGDQNHRSSAPPIPLRPTRHSPIWHSKVACLTYRTRLPTWEVSLRLLEQADGGKSAPRVRHHPSPPASDSSLANGALESGMPHVPHSIADVGGCITTF